MVGQTKITRKIKKVVQFQLDIQRNNKATIEVENRPDQNYRNFLIFFY